MRQRAVEPVVRDVDATVDLIICEGQLAARRDRDHRARALEVLLVDAIRCRGWQLSDGLRARGSHVVELSDELELHRMLVREITDVVVVEIETSRRFHEALAEDGSRRAPVLVVAWSQGRVQIIALSAAGYGCVAGQLDVDALMSQFVDWHQRRVH